MGSSYIQANIKWNQSVKQFGYRYGGSNCLQKHWQAKSWMQQTSGKSGVSIKIQLLLISQSYLATLYIPGLNKPAIYWWSLNKNTLPVVSRDI